MKLSVDVRDFREVTQQSEEKLLGVLMRHPQTLVAMHADFDARDLYSPHIRALYELMLRRAERGQLPDEIDFPIAASRQVPDLDLGWLLHLTEDVIERRPRRLVERIQREATIRRATFGALEMCRELQASEADIESVTSAFAEQLLHRPGRTTDATMPETVPAALESSLQARDNHGIGYPSGLQRFDSFLRFRPGKLYVLAARPGMGKSAFAMQIAQAPADYGPSNWGVMSLEMSAEELTGRLICREAWCDTKQFADGRVSEAVWQRVARASEAIKALPLRIDERGGLTWAQIAAKARTWSLLHGLQGLIIDYAQLIRKRDPRMSNNDHVSEVSQACKALAKSLDVPVVLLSQLNRQCEQRADKRPLCSDLRDSGSLEQDADVVLMLYRGDAYRAADESPDNVAEVIVRKHRGGPCGTIPLRWSGYCARFDDLDTP